MFFQQSSDTQRAICTFFTLHFALFKVTWGARDGRLVPLREWPWWWRQERLFLHFVRRCGARLGCWAEVDPHEANNTEASGSSLARPLHGLTPDFVFFFFKRTSLNSGSPKPHQTGSAPLRFLFSLGSTLRRALCPRGSVDISTRVRKKCPLALSFSAASSIWVMLPTC